MNIRARFAVVSLSALALAGCSPTLVESPSPAPSAPAAQARPAAFPVDKLVGNWGVSSYREEKDRPRTEAMAKTQCKLPYSITKGPTDGVMMHVADDTKLYELTLKGTADGKTYLGFNAPPGDLSDREILSRTDNVMIMRFVDPDVAKRYGTFIYVRCPGGARA